MVCILEIQDLGFAETLSQEISVPFAFISIVPEESLCEMKKRTANSQPPGSKSDQGSRPC